MRSYLDIYRAESEKRNAAVREQIRKAKRYNRQRKYQLKHRLKVSEKHHAYYLAHREEILARAKARSDAKKAGAK